MSIKTLRALCIGDLVTGNPSWGVTWTRPLCVVIANDDDENGKLRVTLRRKESDTERVPTYYLYPNDKETRVMVKNDRGQFLGTVSNLARVGSASRVKKYELIGKAQQRLKEQRSDGDDSWRKYYGRSHARGDD